MYMVHYSVNNNLKEIGNLETIVSKMDKNCVVVSKGNFKVIVKRVDDYVFIVNPHEKTAGEYFVPLCKKMKSEQDAYEKFLHIIGKLTLKGVDSKYFSKPRKEQHLTNGCLPKEYRELVKSMSVEAVNNYWNSLREEAGILGGK